MYFDGSQIIGREAKESIEVNCRVCGDMFSGSRNIFSPVGRLERNFSICLVDGAKGIGNVSKFVEPPAQLGNCRATYRVGINAE
jgi:hypothetical protein